jgi:hypothetical protein
MPTFRNPPNAIGFWPTSHRSDAMIKARLQLPREQTSEAYRDFAIFDPYLRHFLKIRG